MFGDPSQDEVTHSTSQAMPSGSSSLFGSGTKLFGSQKQQSLAPRSLFSSTIDGNGVPGSLFGSTPNPSQPQSGISLFGKPNVPSSGLTKPLTGGGGAVASPFQTCEQTAEDSSNKIPGKPLENTLSQKTPNISSLFGGEKPRFVLSETLPQETQTNTQHDASFTSSAKNAETVNIDPDSNKVSSSVITQTKKPIASTVQPVAIDGVSSSLPSSVPGLLKDNLDKTQNTNIFNLQEPQFGVCAKPTAATEAQKQDVDKLKPTVKESSLPTSSNEKTNLSPHLPMFGTDGQRNEAQKAITETLESNYYERVDDLLKSWQQRTNRQIAGFSRFAEAIVSLDLDLCDCVAQVEKLRMTQTTIETKQQEIDSSLDQIEKHQTTLFEKLQKVQSVLATQPSSTVSVHKEISSSDKFQTKLQSFASSLDDSEVVIDSLISDLNKIQEVLYPGPIGEVVELLNIQQKTVSKLYYESRSLREKLYQLEH